MSAIVPTGQIVNVGGFTVPLERIVDIEPPEREAGTVGFRNLLISGDYIHRESARARIRITPAGRITYTQ